MKYAVIAVLVVMMFVSVSFADVMQMNRRPGVADLSGIKAESSQAVSSADPKRYEIPIYQTMQLKDGNTADVLVNVVKVTKLQLQTQIDNANKQIAELQAKLDAITALEASQVKVSE